MSGSHGWVSEARGDIGHLYYLLFNHIQILEDNITERQSLRIKRNNVEVKDILREYAAGKVTNGQTTGSILDKVAKRSSSLTLLEEVKFFFFYYIDSHLRVLASEIDDETESGFKVAANRVFSSQNNDDDVQNVFSNVNLEVN